MNEKDIEEIRLLNEVRHKCSELPEFLSHVLSAGISGIAERERELMERASDMETMASAMCFLAGKKRVSQKLKEKMSELALSKLSKYIGKTFPKWDMVSGIKNDE